MLYNDLKFSSSSQKWLFGRQARQNDSLLQSRDNEALSTILGLFHLSHFPQLHQASYRQEHFATGYEQQTASDCAAGVSRMLTGPSCSGARRHPMFTPLSSRPGWLSIPFMPFPHPRAPMIPTSRKSQLSLGVADLQGQLSANSTEHRAGGVLPSYSGMATLLTQVQSTHLQND